MNILPEVVMTNEEHFILDNYFLLPRGIETDELKAVGLYIERRLERVTQVFRYYESAKSSFLGTALLWGINLVSGLDHDDSYDYNNLHDRMVVVNEAIAEDLRRPEYLALIDGTVRYLTEKMKAPTGPYVTELNEEVPGHKAVMESLVQRKRNRDTLLKGLFRVRPKTKLDTNAAIRLTSVSVSATRKLTTEEKRELVFYRHRATIAYARCRKIRFSSMLRLMKKLEHYIFVEVRQPFDKLGQALIKPLEKRIVNEQRNFLNRLLDKLYEADVGKNMWMIRDDTVTVPSGLVDVPRSTYQAGQRKRQLKIDRLRGINSLIREIKSVRNSIEKRFKVHKRYVRMEVFETPLGAIAKLWPSLWEVGNTIMSALRICNLAANSTAPERIQSRVAAAIRGRVFQERG